MSNLTALSDRLSTRRRFRTPLAISGTAVLGLSMLLSVGPALGAANHGNGNGSSGNSSSSNTHGTSGNVKVHDGETGVETSGTDNEPHVCSFWLGFEFDAPYEAGNWVVVSWAPTGDGSTVASGVYDTAGDGVDNSGVVEVPAGHYRVEWAASGATSSKKKTFWVDADCGQAASTPDEGSPPEDVAPPTDEPSSPDEGSPPEDVAPPTDEPSSPDEGSPPEELVLAEAETAPQEDGAPADEAPADQAPATDDQNAAPTDQDEAPTAEQAADAAGLGATDPGTPPAQDELGSIGSPEGPTMSDTATPETPVQGGQFAAIVLLLLIGAHMAMRRDRLAPATHN